MRPSRRWLRLLLGTALLAAAMGGCGFDLAGIGEATFGSTTVGGDGGNRADLFVVAPTTLTLDEANENEPARFAVHLTQAPTAPVTIPIAVNPSGRITVKPASVTFTPDNFASDQTVTASVTRNSEIDPSDYVVDLGPATSTDSMFDGATPPKVKLTLKDANQAINISPPVTKTPFNVSESGTTATFYVSLAAKPIDRVVINAHVATQSPNKEIAVAIDDGTVAPPGDAGDDGGDAGADGGSGGTLTFGDTIQIVFENGTEVGTSRKIVVKGMDDDAVDGNQLAQLVFDAAMSTDPRFAGKVADLIPFLNLDNDSPNIEVTTAGPFFTSEAKTGVSPAIKVRLTKAPVGTVTVDLDVDVKTEGELIPPTPLIFTPANYATEQLIPLFGVDDKYPYPDGDASYTLKLKATSSIATDAYNGISLDVPVTNTDNDVAGIVVTPVGGLPLTTTEGGGTASFNVHLKAAPFPGTSVQVTVASSDTTEANVSGGASLTFSTDATGQTSDYATDKLVTLTGVDDNFVDGNINYTATAQIVNDGSLYYSRAQAAGGTSGTVNCKNNDNDVAAVTVSPATLNISEGGAAGSFTVHVGAVPAPGQNVTVVLTPNPGARAQTLNTPSITLTFTSGNFADQTASFQLLDDCYKNSSSNIPINVTFNTSSDPAYAGLAGKTVNITPLDNEPAAAINVSPTSISTTKPATTGSFNVSLTTRPWADVKLGIVSTDTGKGTPDTALLTFTTGDTTCPPPAQTVTVSPGGQTGSYKINVNPDTTTSDPNYKNLDPTDVSVSAN